MLFAIVASAENLKGSVKDEQGNPMPFVTVSVLAEDSTLLTGAITDAQGTYSLNIPARAYIIQASFVGYETAFGGPDFVLKEEAERLKEVEVKAKRPLIEQQMDKLVMNVSQSPLAAGSNGNDILRRAPGVRIDRDGNITVNGKGVEVYVDGRPSYLSGDQLKAMLDGTDGNMIEKIEIISNPSAKYDASGSGGIINIKMKRNMMRGLNGMLSATYGGMYYGDVKQYIQMDAVSLNLNYRGEKTYTFGQVTQVFGQGDIDFETTRTIPETATSPSLSNYSKSGYGVDFQYYMVKVGNDWYIDSVNTFGFILQVPYVIAHQQIRPGRNYAYVVQGGDTVDHSTTASETNRKAPQHTANLNFTHVFDATLDRELTTNIDYNRYNTGSHNVQTTQYETRSVGLDILSHQVVDIYSAKLDFQTKFWQTGMLECGIKYALSSTDNDMTTDSILNGAKISSTPSDFVYREHVGAAYITAGKQFGEHWSVKVGIRGEYTYSHGNWRTADSITNRSYFNPFPTTYVGYTSSPLGKIAQPISASFSYSRRIKRPNYFMLNPFKTYLDAYSYQVGNTDLIPEFNNDMEMHFSWTQYLNATLNFSHTENMFSQRINVLPDGMGEMKWVNFGTCTTFGGNISLTELPIVPKFSYQTDNEGNPTSNRQLSGAWLAITLSGGCYRSFNQSYEKGDDGKPQYQQASVYGYVNGTLSAYLPQNWTLMLDGNWSSPMTIGYDRQSASYQMSFGARKMFMKQGLILNLNVQDLLRSSVYSSQDLGQRPGYSSMARSTIRNQRVMVGLVWMFGQQQQVKRRNVGAMDELNRLGGGDGVSGK